MLGEEKTSGVPQPPPPPLQEPGGVKEGAEELPGSILMPTAV